MGSEILNIVHVQCILHLLKARTTMDNIIFLSHSYLLVFLPKYLFSIILILICITLTLITLLGNHFSFHFITLRCKRNVISKNCHWAEQQWQWQPQQQQQQQTDQPQQKQYKQQQQQQWHIIIATIQEQAIEAITKICKYVIMFELFSAARSKFLKLQCTVVGVFSCEIELLTECPSPQAPGTT